MFEYLCELAIFLRNMWKKNKEDGNFFQLQNARKNKIRFRLAANK